MKNLLIASAAFALAALAACASPSSSEGDTGQSASAEENLTTSALDARVVSLLGAKTVKTVDNGIVTYTANDSLHRVLTVKAKLPLPADITLTGDNGYKNSSLGLAWPEFVKDRATMLSALDTMITQVILNGWGACRQVCNDAQSANTDACFDEARPECTRPDKFQEECGIDPDCIAAKTEACFEAAGVAACAQKKLDSCLSPCGDKPSFH